MYILGGYQKTGTEWLKFILVNLMVGKQDTWGAYDAALPNLDAGSTPASNFFKSHNPHLGIATAGIAQVRHPFDVCMSAYRYVKEVDKLEVPPIEVFIDLFIHNRGEITFNQLNGCDYVDHVKTWIDQDNARIVRHEDLRSPAGVAILHAALFNIGFGFSFEKVWRAMDRASVDRMRKLDNRNFLGTVKMGTWKDVWSEDQRFRGGIAFRSIIDRFGYEQ